MRRKNSFKTEVDDKQQQVSFCLNNFMATPAAGHYLVETVPVQPNCDRRPENTISTVSRRERGCETDEDKLCVRMNMCLSWSSYAEPSLTPVLFHNLPHAYPRPQRIHPCRDYPPSMVRHPRKRGRALTLLHRKQEFKKKPKTSVQPHQHASETSACRHPSTL